MDKRWGWVGGALLLGACASSPGVRPDAARNGAPDADRVHPAEAKRADESGDARRPEGPSKRVGDPGEPVRDDDPGGAKRVEEGIRFVDRELGFEIQRPAGSEWSFAHGHEAPGGIQVPVIVSHAATGAQVVVQVAPQVAPAQEFAERLAVGLRTKQGFTTTVPEATANGSNFLFSLGDQIHGRVAVIASDDRLYVLLGTWPASAPSNVARDVDAIMRSLRTAVITEATR